MPKFSKIEIETPKTEIKLDTQQNPDIGLERLGGAFLNLEVGDVPEAISRHNLDEASHPYIIANFAKKTYVTTAIEEHNTSDSAHEDIRNALKTYIHEQGIANNVWTIQHNLNKYPAVSVVDSAGNEIISDVHYVDTNNIIIYLNAPFKGKAYLN